MPSPRIRSGGPIDSAALLSLSSASLCTVSSSCKSLQGGVTISTVPPPTSAVLRRAHSSVSLPLDNSASLSISASLSVSAVVYSASVTAVALHPCAVRDCTVVTHLLSLSLRHCLGGSQRPTAHQAVPAASFTITSRWVRSAARLGPCSYTGVREGSCCSSVWSSQWTATPPAGHISTGGIERARRMYAEADKRRHAASGDSMAPSPQSPLSERTTGYSASRPTVRHPCVLGKQDEYLDATTLSHSAFILESNAVGQFSRLT